MNDRYTPENDAKVKRSLEFQVMLNDIAQRINNASSFFDVMPAIEADMLKMLRAERMTVYQRGRHNQEIVSKFKSGDDSMEIRVPLSTTSIAGYVALSQKSLRIDDVYDQATLRAIHPNLQFDASYDKTSGFRTHSMMATPIKHGNVLLGVLQVLNHADGGSFSNADLENTVRLAMVIGRKFSSELDGTSGPYEFLIKNRKVSLEDLKALEKEAKETNILLTRLLRERYKLSRDEIGESLEHYYQVPYMGYDDGIILPEEIMSGVSANYLIKALWVPVSGTKEEVTVLLDNPSDHDKIMEIQRVLNAKRYIFKVSLPEDIRAYLGAGDDVSGAKATDLVDQLTGDVSDELVDEGSKAALFDVLDEGAAPIIKLVNRVILDAYQSDTSDIHIEPSKGSKPAVVRYRIDGICREVLKIPAGHVNAVVSRIKVMASLDIAERRVPQDGKIKVNFRGKSIELRVATLPTVNGESVVMRILAASEPLPLDKLNLSNHNYDELLKAIAHPHGIMLVVGPTGSGKTTTLHSVLGYLNQPDRKIWTAEDPVEITQQGLSQVQVKPKIGFDFAAALRAFLRADPDIIMIGEMRDAETAHAGVEASLTGHLVLSTLHTNSAPETITRLLDIGLNPINFSDALLAVLAQRLVRTLCAKCKAPSPASEDEFDLLETIYTPALFPELGVKKGELQLMRAVGCKDCGGSGYRGRTGVHELLVATPAIKKMIYKGSTVNDIRDQALKEGMRTLLQDGVWKVVKGDTDMEQLKRVVSD